MKRIAILLALLAASACGALAQMGTTWVVFIENSTYNAFPSINGPKEDVAVMREALKGYQIDKVVHKQNMGKAQLNSFFKNQLPGMIKEGGVSSLLVWYAGHGKYINSKSYWVPTDAVRDNEATYFEITALKQALQAMPGVEHALVVSDACESGPSFYQAMRSNPPERSCADASVKSAQVFTASGYDLAVQNSKFTTSFASSLKSNGNACIPIEKVVAKVTMDVVMSSGQRPKFGTIDGANDGGGTFFFVKK